MDRERLIELLISHLEGGSLDAEVLRPAIAALRGAEGERPALWDLLRALEGAEGPELERVRQSALRALVARARAARGELRGGGGVPPEVDADLGGLPVDAPAEWAAPAARDGSLERVLGLYRELDCVDAQPVPLPKVRAEIVKWLDAARERALAVLPPWALVSPRELLEAARPSEAKEPISRWLALRAAVERDEVLGGKPSPRAFADERALLEDLRQRFHAAAAQAERQRILDRVLAWPTMLAATVIPGLCTEGWARDRAVLVLELRFGSGSSSSLQDWPWWERWLEERNERVAQHRAAVASAAAGNEASVLRFWYACLEQTDPERQRALDAWSRETATPMTPDEFLRRRGPSLEAMERRAFGAPSDVQVDAPAPPAAVESEPALPPAVPTPEAPTLAPPPRKGPFKEAEPAAPSFWKRHVQAFLVENWFMVAGILMVVVGASILAYFTWDKHWLIRYTIMPALLGGFTFAIAALGGYLERQGEDLKDAAAMLRGAAVFLLPINFMAVALLSGDGDVGAPWIVVPLMAALYLVIFGFGLRRWCRAIDPRLGVLLGGTLLFLDSLVFLRPLGESLISENPQWMPLVLGTGFHVGFLVLAAAVVLFSERILTPELARRKRVPWFFGLTLGVTWLQVFLWVHGSAGYLPQVHTYAPLIVLAGGLILYVERKSLELRGQQQLHEVESFLGFAAILLGVLMAAGNPWTRIVALVLGGAVWLYQAARRDQELHRWIGLSLLLGAGAAIAKHPAFPETWIPGLGLALAAAFGGAGHLLRRRAPESALGRAASQMSLPVLLLTAVSAVVIQWRTHSEPLWTGGLMILIAAVFAHYARREQRVRWLYTAMVLLAVALPYLGCVDLSGRSWHGNTMVFGLAVLSVLWIAANALIRTPLMRAARSTVLWTYGALAVGGMVVRVLFEPVVPADAESMRVLMNYSGPLLMAAALGIATYTSRSLVPAFMAATIVIILFPELQARFEDELAAVGWGTGIGSAVNALWMTLLCFALRGWKRLKDLGPGDRFLGLHDFPLVRRDHTLFTWPLVVSALFLLARTNTITLARHFPDVGTLTALSLCCAGVAWTLQAVYHRRRLEARLGTHLGWISLLIGVGFLLPRPASELELQNWLFILGAVLTGLYLLYRLPPIGSQPWSAALLRRPLERVLGFGTVALTAAAVPWALSASFAGVVPWFLMLLAAHCVWHALRTGWHLFGILLFALVWSYLAGNVAPGFDPSNAPEMLRVLGPTLWLLLGAQLLLLPLEAWRGGDRPLRALREPCHVLSSVLALVAATVAVALVPSGETIATHECILLAGVLLLAARATGSSGWTLAAAFVSFVFLRLSGDAEALRGPACWEQVFEASGLAILAAVLVALNAAGSLVEGRAPWLLRGRFAWPLPGPQRALPLLLLCGAGLALVAAAQYALLPRWHDTFTGTWIPCFTAITLSVAALRLRFPAMHVASLLVICVGNVFGLRALLGETLSSWGLSDLHAVCLGLMFSLGELSVLRFAIPSPRARLHLRHACLGLGGLILLLLTANYLSHPDLASIKWPRFAISGTLALLAGSYFRWVARSSEETSLAFVRFCEGMYHYGLALAIGCAALLIPVLRQPATAMFALGMPALYFYARAEMLAATRSELAERYRGSAGVLCSILLFLYVFRAGFRVAFFPEDAVQVGHYHWNAPLVMLLGVVMIRLRGLGASTWSGYFGGLAVMIGSYFLLTWLPGLSPFADPVPSAWCAIALGHAWILVSSRRSPLGSAIQRLAGLGEEGWLELRTGWGSFLLLAAHVGVLWGLGNCQSTPHAWAPLLAGAATISLHVATLRRSTALFALAGAELFLALHADFFIESFIDQTAIVWVILGLWTAALVLQALRPRVLDPRHAGTVAACFFAVSFAHVLHLQPWSVAGLWAMGLASALALLTPRGEREGRAIEEAGIAGAFLFVPTWLVYFALIGSQGFGPGTATDPLICGVTILVLLVTGGALRVGAQQLGARVRPLVPPEPRLIDATRQVVIDAGGRIGVALVGIALGATAGLQLFHAGSSLEQRELLLIPVIYAAIAWEAWQALGTRRPGIATVVVQLAALGFLIGARTATLQLRPGLWEPLFDVWVTLGLATLLTGARPLLDRGPPEVRRALLPLDFLLPAFALGWILAHDLGPDLALLVVGLHSLLFAYLGKDERESPYRITAIAGFVAFVLITFHAKLGFREVSAYVIPVGLGILALVQMLQRHMTLQTRNRIRAATGCAMLGSAAYYALIDPRYTVAFNLTLFLLCLAAMAAGALMRVRLFLLMGFGGLVVSLASILYRVLDALERSMRLTSVGLLVLLVGVLFVGGTVYYKTHRTRVDARLAAWRRRIGEWE